MDYNALHTAARNRIGFRDMFSTKDYISLDSDLLTTNSGLFVNSISEVYLRPEMIDQFLEFAEGFNVDAWDSAADYGQAGGIIVIRTINDRDQAFVAKANSSENNVNKVPETEPDFWETFLSFRLKQYRESAAHEVINELTTVKQLSSNTPVVKNYDRLFHMPSRPENLQISDNFRCMNIVPNDTNSIEMELKQIGLVLDTAQTITFYLFHSDSQTALQTFDVTIAAGEVNNFVWKDLVDGSGNPLIIRSLGDTNSGGIFLFGFFEDDITGNILSWEYNYYLPLPFTATPQVPGFINYLIWRAFRPYYSFYPGFYEGTANKPFIPDVGQYFDDGNYDDEIPFNLKLTIREDHTNVLLDNISRLDKLIQLKWAILLLTDMMHTFRRNSDADRAQNIEKILNREVTSEGTNGNFTERVSQGIIGKYDLELKSAKKDLIALTTNNFGLVQTF